MAVAGVLTGTAVLGMLPPVMGRAAPSTVLERVPVRLPHARAADAPEGRALRTPPATVCAPMVSTMAGLVWRQEGDEPVGVELSWGEEGSFGDPLRLIADPDHAPDPGTTEAERTHHGTDPVWIGEGRCLRFRLDLPEGTRVEGVQAVFLNTSGTADGSSLLGSLTDALGAAWRVLGGTWLGFSAPPADARVGRPGIITRAEWGADEGLRRCGPGYADRLKMSYVHHTAGSNSYSKSQADDVVRGIYAYHTQGRGYCDIAYNFLVDRFGRTYEGRYGGMTEPVVGAHAAGFNTGSAGVAAIGNFTSLDPPTRMLRALKRLLAWRLDVAHLDPKGTARMTSGGGSSTKYEAGEQVTLPVIAGHRDTGYTACPGDRLFAKLKAIRRGAQRIGLPKIWNPTQSRESVQYGQSEVRIKADLSEDLSWTVTVLDDLGNAVRSFSGRGSSVDVAWDGTAGGAPVPDGTYRVRIEARAGPDGRRARPADLTVHVHAACTLVAPSSGGLVVGTDGDDVLCGGPGKDELRGRDGDDTLLGAGGNDVLQGQAGNDILIGGPGDDVIQGNGGFDTASFQGAPNGVTVDLAAGIATGEGTDTLLGMDDVIGSPQADKVIGSETNNVLDGRDGDDVLVGSAGSDRLIGGPGSDTVDYRTAPGPVSIFLAAGRAEGHGSDTLAGVENAVGTRWDDRLVGNAAANRLRGLAGDDALIGRPGADVLVGGRGQDIMRGGGGDDRLRARDKSRDLVVGGPGNDLARIDTHDAVRKVEQVR